MDAIVLESLCRRSGLLTSMKVRQAVIAAADEPDIVRRLCSAREARELGKLAGFSDEELDDAMVDLIRNGTMLDQFRAIAIARYEARSANSTPPAADRMSYWSRRLSKPKSARRR